MLRRVFQNSDVPISIPATTIMPIISSVLCTILLVDLVKIGSTLVGSFFYIPVLFADGTSRSLLVFSVAIILS